MLSPELIPIHERLVNIRRQLVALAAKEAAMEAGGTGVPPNLSNISVLRAPAARDSSSLPGTSTPNSEEALDHDDSKTPTKESTPKAEVPKEG